MFLINCFRCPLTNTEDVEVISFVPYCVYIMLSVCDIKPQHDQQYACGMDSSSCYGYWDSNPYLYYICVFIGFPISPSHLRQCIHRVLLPLNDRIALRTFIMHWQTQNILIFFSKVVLQMPLAHIILFNVMRYLTIHLLNMFQVIRQEYIQ